MGSIIRIEDEQQVNSTAKGHQGDPAVTMLADGGWVVTWRSTNEGTGLDVVQQRYNRDGSPHDGQIKVNTFSRTSVLSTATTALDDGGWVVAWVAHDPFDPASKAYGVYLQRYDRDGKAVGSEERVAVSYEANQTDVTITGIEGGGWVVAWQAGRLDGTGSYDIYQRQYGVDGLAGDAALVHTASNAEQKRPSIARLEGSGWIVTWDSIIPDGTGLNVVQQRFSVNGDPIEGEARVNVHTPWDQSLSSVAALADGGWIVTWSSTDQDGIDVDIHQQRYYADGTPRGSEQKVNTYSLLEQNLPKVTGLDDGGWVVTWHSYFQGDGSYSIHQQRYDKNGMAIRGEQRVNVFDTGVQLYQDMTGLKDGGWVVTWQSDQQDGDGSGIFQRRYEAVAAFGAGLEDGFGTDENEVFDVLTGGLDIGDTLDAGGGIDTLRMIGSGVLELTAPTRFTGIEIIQGSGGDDDIVFDAARISSVIGIQGGAGRDRLHLKSGSYDFTHRFVGGIETILLIKSTVTFADKAMALLAHSQRQDSAVILIGDTFTAGERHKLYDQGIRQVTDAGGVHVLQQATAALSGTSVEENVGSGSIVGTLSVVDPNPGDGLQLELVDSAGGRFALSANRIVVANGKLLDFEKGSAHQIVVRVTDEGGIVSDKSFTISVSDAPSATLKGNARANRLTSDTSEDQLYGGLGRDTLTGGAGEDIFVFDTKPNTKTNRDIIVDYSVGEDVIWLDNKIFTKLGKAGTASAPAALKDAFFAADKAKDRNDYLVYDSRKGVLLYDADGSGKGKAVEIATLSKKLAMTHKDFFVI